MESLQNQDLEQDNLQQVRICEPLDEFNPGIDPEEEEDLIWDHSGDLQSPPIDSESSGLINIEDGVNESRWSTAFNRVDTSLSRQNTTPERIRRPRLNAVSELEVENQEQEINSGTSSVQLSPDQTGVPC